MPLHPEYLQRRLSWERRYLREADKAASLLEAVIDQFISAHAADLLAGGVRFPLAKGTDSGILTDITERYRNVGWLVEIEDVNDDQFLVINLAESHRKNIEM